MTHDKLPTMSGNQAIRRSLKSSPPQFLQPIVITDEDDVRTFECRVDGYPRPDIRWEKFGRPIGKSRRVHMTRCGDRCLLQIKMPQVEDQGLYSCIATNIEGTATTQMKVSTPYFFPRKMNGTSKPSPNKINGLRSRSTERSTIENSSECSTKSRVLRNGFRLRSQSGSGKSRQDNLTLPTKSKLATFTSHIWRKNSKEQVSVIAHSSENVTSILNPDKKRLCKSTEDCRKAKRNFLNRVKIPEIFDSPQKSESKSTFHCVTPLAQNINCTKLENDLTKPNGNQYLPLHTNKTIINGNTFNDIDKKLSVQSENVPVPLTTRERIAAYLKKFENTATDKSKDIPPAKVNKISSNTRKSESVKEHKTSNSAESDNFFNKFRRRKSSGNNAKNSHKDPGLNQIVVQEAGPILDKCHFEQCIVKDKSFPLTNGETSVNDSSVENISTNHECTENIEANEEPEDIALMESENDNSNDIDLNCLTFEKINVNILEELDQFKTSDNSSTELHLDSDEPTAIASPLSSENEVVEIKEVAVPSIHIHLSPEDNEEGNKSDDSIEEIIIPKESPPPCSNHNRQSDSLFFNKPFKGCIRYSNPLIEEECESLYGNGEVQQAEILEAGLERVSSPVESPARIVKGPQSVTILRGESVTLAISFSGHPPPRVIWMKGGRVLTSNGRLSILEGREMSVVSVNDVTADDSGKYVVSVENDGGGDSCFASVAVVGFPEPPGGEPTASEVTDHSLVLSWYGSMYDGGSVVTGYQVEMCTLPDRTWYKVTSSVNTSCSVLGLSKGQRYIFRVRAENRYGLSHPSKESKVICLDDFLKSDSSSDEEPGDVDSPVISVENGTQFTERFDLKEEVGKGRFGTVYRCVEKSCGRPRAAKVIRCLKLKDKDKVRQEIEIMSRLHHPKLMQVLAAFESGRNMIMVMEYISGGELFERVIADDFVLTEQDCVLFMRQICKGVAYMHKNNVIHLDLKPENILCKTRTSHKIKIIDFGLARIYKAEENLRVLFGTPEFVAPEVINYEPVSPASDMWSVGVICYVLISGLSPFMGDSDTETFANITRGEMDFDDEAFDEISEDAKDFISQLLVKPIKGRMSADECLKHPWLAAASQEQKRPLSTEKLKRFIIRRKWQKSGTAIRALGRMVSLSRSSLGSSSCDSPIGSPTSSRSRSSLMSRSETAESGESDVFQDIAR